LVKRAILHAIPSLGTDPFSVGPVLRTLQTVCDSKSLLPLSIRLLFKLWVVQERTFPHLQSALQGAIKTLVPGDRPSNELALSVAVTVCELAKAKPSLYSDELLPLISGLLSKTNLVAAKVYSLKALNYFCEAQSQSPFACQ